MAPMIREDTLDLLDDVLGVNFDEITRLATSDENFLGSDLAYAELQPTVVVQPASPATPALETPVMAQGENFLFDSSKLSGDNGLDTISQPASPLHMPPEFFLNPYSQPASPEFLVLENSVADPQQAIISEHISSLYQDLTQLSTSPESFTASPASSYMLCPSPQSPTPSPASSYMLCPSPQSPTPSPASSYMLCPSPESLTASTTSSYVLSPSSVCQEEEVDSAPQPTVDAPKKRGRKRKYPEGMAPSRRRPKTPKVYEMGPLDDDEKEKKRKNAVNAKRHRDAQKAEKQKLSWELEQAKAERDELVNMVNQFKLREEQLLQVLRVHGINTNSLHATPVSL